MVYNNNNKSTIIYYNNNKKCTIVYNNNNNKSTGHGDIQICIIITKQQTLPGVCCSKVSPLGPPAKPRLLAGHVAAPHRRKIIECRIFILSADTSLSWSARIGDRRHRRGHIHADSDNR